MALENNWKGRKNKVFASKMLRFGEEDLNLRKGKKNLIQTLRPGTKVISVPTVNSVIRAVKSAPPKA